VAESDALRPQRKQLFRSSTRSALFPHLIPLLVLGFCPLVLHAGPSSDRSQQVADQKQQTTDPADSLWLPELRVQGFVRPAWNDLSLGQADLDAFALGALDEVLLHRSALNLKDYGAGQLVTAGYRGGAARHTVMRWNGMRLNSPSHGTTDLSVLPLSGLQKLRLSGGTAASSRTGSALGGLLDLETGAPATQGTAGSVSAGWGSFGQWQTESTMEYGMSMWQGRSLFGISRADNDFPVPHPVLADVRMPDAEWSRWYAVQDFGGRAGEQGYWTAAFSGSGTQRNLPPGLQTTDQGEWQEDQMLLGAARYTQALGGWQTALRLGWLDERIRYRNQAADLQSDARSKAQEIGLEAGRSWHLGRSRDRQHIVSLDNQLALRREQVVSSGFGEAQEFLELRLLSSLIWSPVKRFYLQADLIQDRYGADWMPTQPVLRVHGLLLQRGGPGDRSAQSTGGSLQLEAGTGLARHYARPALNDRFWEPGGNPDLLAEQGWLADADARLSVRTGQGLDMALHGSAWSGRIAHWIQWTPGSGGWWQASNLHEVYSRGAELRLALQAELESDGPSGAGSAARWKLAADVLYSHTRLRTASGDRLLYQPGQRASATLGVQGRGLRLGLRYAYTGQQPVQTDGSRNLPAFGLLGADAGYTRRLARWEMGLSLQLDNLLNDYIESVLNRPQPGRAGRLVLTLSRLPKPDPINTP
jgi:vitamin B12 transporter